MKVSRRNETVSVIAVVTFVFAVLFGLVILLFSTQYERADLSLENRIERAYSKLMIAVQEGNDAVIHAMEDVEVIGFGYYTAQGEAKILWGDGLHTELPFSFFSNTNVPYFKESNVVGYDEETGIVECIRYFSPGASKEDYDTIPFEELAGETTNYVIYISMLGSDYISTVRSIGVGSAVAITLVAGLYILVLCVLLQNVRYRDRLREQESLVALGQAARTLTHEIKNPLSAITLQAALLKRTAPESIQDDLKVITQESERLSRLSAKVSEFLRNPIGEPEDIDINEFVAEMSDITDRDIPFISNVESDQAIISFDRDRLRSVIENIVINAIQAGNGSVEGMEIVLNMGSRKKVLNLVIKDRGCGILPEHRKKVFDPFFTTKVQGSGIGLSISKKFLNAAGGDLVIDAREGGGTEVTLVFKRNL